MRQRWIALFALVALTFTGMPGLASETTTHGIYLVEDKKKLFPGILWPARDFENLGILLVKSLPIVLTPQQPIGFVHGWGE